MKAVISASRRTDIPAFYLKWFMEQIRRGYIDIPNPFNRKQVKRTGLTPREVAWIVFWSRNYSVFLKNQDFFDNYRLFFHFTINPPNALLEPGLPEPAAAFKQMEELAGRYGAESVVWRYDPIVFYKRNGEVQTNHDIQLFRKYVRTASLMGIQRCYISVVNIYPKIIKRAKKIPDFEFFAQDEKIKLEVVQDMVDLASLYGVQLYSCSNDNLLRVSGLRKGQCINGRLLNRLGHEKVSEQQSPSRTDCGCTLSVDVGDYARTRCKYKCLYCYARP